MSTTTREIGVASAGGYPRTKRPVLYLQEGSSCRVLAYFKDQESLNLFMSCTPCFKPVEIEKESPNGI